MTPTPTQVAGHVDVIESDLRRDLTDRFARVVDLLKPFTRPDGWSLDADLYVDQRLGEAEAALTAVAADARAQAETVRRVRARTEAERVDALRKLGYDAER